MGKKSSVSRRTFLNRSATGTLGLMLAPSAGKMLQASVFDNDKSPVILVKDADAIHATTKRIDTQVVQSMLDASIRILTGINDLGEAWKKFFPGISAQSRISIKVNCINSKLSSHPEVAYAIAAGLTQMQFDGVPFSENNVIIFDRTEAELKNARYSINTSGTGVRCFATNSSGGGYSGKRYDIHGSPQPLSNILVAHSDYMINLSVLKNHSIAGVTLSMKNHYGTCKNPSYIHANSCSPYIAALNNAEPIRNKQKLCICDAIYGIVSGGPSGYPQVAPRALIVSRDPVALDTVGAQLLEQNGCKTVSNAIHIRAAASVPYLLGTNDPNKIQIQNIENPSTQLIENPPTEKSRVVQVRDERAVRVGDDNGRMVREDIVQVMVDEGIRSLTGEADTGEAWKGLFPGITGNSVIGIKVNCEQSRLSTHPEVTLAVVGSLIQMQVEGRGFPENNIIIWDRHEADLTAAGYRLNVSGEGVRVLGTDSSGMGYIEPAYPVAGGAQKLSAVLSREIDYMIDLSVLAHHETVGAALGLYNQSRSIENSESVYTDAGNPGIAEVNHLPPIRNRQVLHICDALLGSVDSGTAGNDPVVLKQLVISRDPVAHDRIASEILRSHGCETVDRAAYIGTAAHIPYNLGTDAPEWIELEDILNPSLGIVEDPPDLKSRVVRIQDEHVLVPGGESMALQPEVIQTMVDAGIAELTGLETVGHAWKSLFPGITSGSKVGIRVHCDDHLLSTHPAVAEAVVHGLMQMEIEGQPFQEEKIIVWDRSEAGMIAAGYTLRTQGTGYRCYATDSPGKGYSASSVLISGSQQQLSRILSEEIDYYIDLPVLRFHASAGVDLSLMGALQDCHDPQALSRNHYDPGVAELNRLPAVQDKYTVTLCDAVYGQITANTEALATPRMLIFSRDRVAHDAVASGLLETEGCESTGLAVHIHTAAHYPYELGTDDPEWIDVTDISNPSEGSVVDPSTGVSGPGDGTGRPDRFELLPNFPNPFNAQTRIEYYLPETRHVELEILDTRGRRINRLVNKKQNRGLHSLIWDGRSQRGTALPSGTYVARLRSAGMLQVQKMLMIR